MRGTNYVGSPLVEDSMARNALDLADLEALREAGDYARVAAALADARPEVSPYDDEAIRLRLLAAAVAAHNYRPGDMETVLAPYFEGLDRVPLGLAPRVLLGLALYRHRRGEAEAALRLARRANTIAAACEDDAAVAEAMEMEGQALWLLERWDEAAGRFEQAITLFAGQARPYRLGLAHLCLGAVRTRRGDVEAARGALERAVRILLKFADEYNLGVARLNTAQALNALGEHEAALRYLELARDIFGHAPNQNFACLTLTGIAATLHHLKRYDQAEEYAAAALAAGAEAGSLHLAAVYEVKARIHLSQEAWERAERALRAALELSEPGDDRMQRAEVLRTLGRYHLLREQDEEAARALCQALEIAEELQAALLEMEIKALLARAVCLTNPAEALQLAADVETTLGDRPLPEVRRDAQAARKRINALEKEHYFVLSDVNMPVLADAKIAMLKWLWSRALYQARGNSRDAAAILDVTPTYIRKLTKAIPRDLLRPGKKRARRARDDGGKGEGEGEKGRGGY